MSGYMYVCPGCKKVYKVNGSGKKAKCPNCTKILVDMKITPDEWNGYDKAQKIEAVSDSIIVIEEVEDMSQYFEGKATEGQSTSAPSGNSSTAVSNGTTVSAPAEKRLDDEAKGASAMEKSGKGMSNAGYFDSFFEEITEEFEAEKKRKAEGKLANSGQKKQEGFNPTESLFGDNGSMSMQQSKDFEMTEASGNTVAPAPDKKKKKSFFK